MGQNEDYGLEDSIQVALRNCSKVVGGGGQYISDFGEGAVHAIKHVFFCRRFLLITRSSSSHHERL